jgi:PAS domain S-box-containing protein
LTPEGPASGLHDVLDSIGDGFFAIDSDWRITRVNQRVLEVTQRARTEVEGALFWDVFADLRGGWIEEVLRRAMTRQEGTAFEALWPFTQRWYHVTVHPRAGGLALLGRDITGRRRAEQRLEAVLGSINDHLASYDRDWRYTYVNEPAAQLLGRQRDELLGRSIWELFPDAVGNEFYQQVHRAVAEQRIIRAEHYYAPFNRWYENHIYPSPDGVTVFASDITWRKQGEAHQALLAELGALLQPDRRADETFDVVARLVVTRLDVAAATFYRVTGDELADEAAESRRLPGFGAAAETLRAGELLVCDDVSGDSRLGYIALTWPDVRACVAVPCIRDRQWVGGFFVRSPAARRWSRAETELLRIVAERTWLAVDRMRLAAATRESEQYLRNALVQWRLAMRVAHMGTWEFDPGTGRVSASESADLMYGLSPAAGPRTLDAYLDRVHPDDRDRLRRETVEAAAEGRDIATEYRILNPDGSIRWVASRGDIVHDSSGANVRMLGALFDITERKRAEEALREADRRKDEFLATLAHELRNPLAPIRSAVDVLQLDALPDSKTAWAGRVIDRQLQQLTRLVDDLLEVSRITLGKIELRRSLTDLASVVDRALETSRPALDAAGHELTIELPDETVCLVADGARLAQVLDNLLQNAAKYTRPGGRVRLTARRSDRELTIVVADNGIGIPPAMLERVFDMFAQADASLTRTQGGLGVGLTIVRRLVEMHHGTVEARSEGPGRGSEFIVTLPLTGRDAGEALVPRPARPSTDGLSGRRVLVVDDNRDAAESLALLLEVMEATVWVAFDGPAALEAVRRHLPEIAILDLGMPGMTGYDVARQLRADPATAGLTLIAVTGWGQEEDRRRTRDAGFDHHLVKPVELDELMRILGATLPSRGAPAAPARS